MKLLHGYKLNVQNAGNLYYDASGASKKSSPVTSRKSSPETVVSHRELLRKYSFRPPDYEFSATLIAEVTTPDGSSFIGPRDLLLAYHGEELRGLAQARYVPGLDKTLFILTYYSGEKDQEISFRIRLNGDAAEYTSDLSLAFTPDNISGEPYRPLRIEFGDPDLLRNINSGGGLTVWPNPASDRFTVSSPDDLTRIRLYDITGAKILDMKCTARTITVPVQNLEPGIYTLRAETDHQVLIRKIVKTSF